MCIPPKHFYIFVTEMVVMEVGDMTYLELIKRWGSEGVSWEEYKELEEIEGGGEGG